MSYSSRRAGREAGFTLIEILIAIAVLATLATIVAMSFSSTFRVIEAFEQDGGEEHLARLCLGLIAEEVLAGRLGATAPWIGRNGEENGRPADILAFASAGHVRVRANAMESDLMRVVYAREGNRLVRIAMRNLYGLSPEAVEQFDLATGVAAFNLRYYDRTVPVWVDEWDGMVRNTLPGAVMIELTFMGGRGQLRTFTQWVSIPSQSS